MTLKELREKLAEQAKVIRQMADKVNNESRDFTPEEKTQWDAANNDYNALLRKIEIAKRAAEVEAATQASDSNTPGAVLPGRDDRSARTDERGDDRRGGPVTEETRANAFQAWARFQLGLNLEDRHEDACRVLRFNPSRQFIDIPLVPSHAYRQLQQDARSGRREMRDLSAVAGPTGGYTVAPQTLVQQLELNMLYFGGVRQVAENIRTTTGEPMAWPTANDTSNTGAQLGENTSIGSSTDPSFGKVTWNAYKFSSKPILVPFELLQDSAFDLASIIGQMLGERLGRITNTKYTTGTAAATPNGIVTASTLGKTTNGATAITADEISDLVFSVDVAYRSQPGCQFMMSDGILSYIRKLKSANNEYIWTPNFVGGMAADFPDRLFGYPYTVNNDMVGLTTGAPASATKTMLFGQMSKYKIRTVGSVRLYRLEERYRDTDQDGFIAFVREDGNLLDAGTAPVKHLLQA